MVTDSRASSRKSPSGTVYQRRATAALAAAGRAARPTVPSVDPGPVGVADAPVLDAGTAVGVAGAHADGTNRTAEMSTIERTTTSSYEGGMRNLCVDEPHRAAPLDPAERRRSRRPRRHTASGRERYGGSQHRGR